MKTEIWKSIAGYEGIYEVSSFGRVRSLAREHITGFLNRRSRLTFDKILKPGWHGEGPIKYQNVVLCYKGYKKKSSIHRLVAMAFIPNPENKPFINHINGDPSCNNVENLEWVTPRENTQHAMRMGLKKPKPGRTIEQISLTGELVKVFKSGADIQRELGINEANIRAVCTGRQTTAYGFKWRYPLKTA